MTTDHIKAAAQEAGFAGWKCDEAKIQRLYAIAFAAGMERAAEICESEWSNVAEKMYGQDCADAIRAEAHAQNPPKNVHDGSVV